jgi:hypothetical protein
MYVCRDISPHNMVVTEVAGHVHGYLIDYHVSAPDAELQVTGKPATYALEVHDALRQKERQPGAAVVGPIHKERTEGESLFYTMLDFDSDGIACTWRKAANEREMHCIKLTTMFNENEWKHALSYCSAELQPLFTELHQRIFAQYSPQQYLQRTFTFAEFLDVVRLHKQRLQGAAPIVDEALHEDIAASQQSDLM